MHQMSRARLTALLLTTISAQLQFVFNESEARIFLQYARASFCDIPQMQNWDCGDMCINAPIVNGSARPFGRTYYNEGQGFVALLPSHIGPTLSPNKTQNRSLHRCVAAFRGSVDVMNWVDDGQFWRTAWPNWDGANPDLCPNCNVHHGAASTYQELRPLFFAAIKELGCDTLALTGHSLGGSLASMAALEVRKSLGLVVNPVYTFGKLRQGGEDYVNNFVAAAHAQGVWPPMWRVVENYDPVPRIPPRHLGYVHEPLEVFYPSEKKDSFWVCPAAYGHYENASCSAATTILGCLGNAKEDHNSYMNTTTISEELPTSCINPTYQNPQRTVVQDVLIPLLFAAVIVVLILSGSYAFRRPLCDLMRHCGGWCCGGQEGIEDLYDDLSDSDEASVQSGKSSQTGLELCSRTSFDFPRSF